MIKVKLKNTKIKRTFANFQSYRDLSQLGKFIQEFKLTDCKCDCQCDKNSNKDIQTKQSSSCISTQTKIKTFTSGSYEKTKNVFISKPSISKNKTPIILDDVMNIMSLKQKNLLFEEEDDSEENAIVHQIKIVIELLKYYCKYKEVRSSSSITIEIIENNCQTYSQLFSTFFSKIKQLPVYCCSFDKLDEIIKQQYSRTRLNDLILKQYRCILRQTINSNDILSTLFEILKDSNFPLLKFNKKHEITFLMMFSQAISKGKNKNMKNKRKNKNSNNNDKLHQCEEQQDNPTQQELDTVYDLVANLNNDDFLLPISTSSQFINLITAKLKKLIQK